jgi:hypothetical protein
MKPDPTKDSTGAAAGKDLPRYMPERTIERFHLSMHEIGVMVLLTSFVDPELFEDEGAKAIIYKCRGATTKVGRDSRVINFKRVVVSS